MSNRHALHQAKRRDRLRNAKRHDISRNARRHRSITRAPTQSGSQRKAGPNAKRVPQLKPSCGTRCCIRAVIIAKPPCTHCLRHAAYGKRKPAPFRPRSDTWEHRTIRSEESALHISPGRVLFGAQESLVLSTRGQNERFLPAYALRGGPFQRFFAHGEPFLPKTALLWAISRKESFILSRCGQNERFFATHERKRPLQPR